MFYGETGYRPALLPAGILFKKWNRKYEKYIFNRKRKPDRQAGKRRGKEKKKNV